MKQSTKIATTLLVLAGVTTVVIVGLQYFRRFSGNMKTKGICKEEGGKIYYEPGDLPLTKTAVCVSPNTSVQIT